VPVDDEFGLLPDQQGAPPPPQRPMWLVLGGLVLVALVAVGAVFWLVASLADRGRTVTAAGTPSPVAATTPAPTPTPVATTPPVSTVPPTTAPSTVVPAPSATAIVPTPTPAPTTRPVPRPTLTIPVGRLVRVPDVVGLKVARAGTVLRAAGFRVQVIGGVLDPERDDRRIVAQRPTAGSAVRAGSTVILVTDGT
jgi:PASTA domain